MNRTSIADLIVERLEKISASLSQAFIAHSIQHCVLDDLLPPELARSIYAAFPSTDQMALKKSLKELKYVTAQMDRCSPLLEEAIFAFHDPRIVALVARITGVREPEADSRLYAGGISLMNHGHFLNPHIDNSHDRTRERYRVLNLLYYVSPGWELANGGNLELWPDGPRRDPVTIPSLFNRLVIMKTDRNSWHSVSRVRTHTPRCCVSNYYFSARPPQGDVDYFHVTSFRGRPEQPVRDAVLRVDISLRSLLRKIRPMGIVPNPHYYKQR